MVLPTLLLMAYFLLIGIIISLCLVLLFRKITNRTSALNFFTAFIVACIGLATHFFSSNMLPFIFLEVAALTFLVRGIRQEKAK